MTMVDRARQGRRNRTAGLNWNRACVLYLRNWWPSAERQLREHRSDLDGIGDIGIETTIEPWAQLWKKMAQAESDAHARGLDVWCVWKKRNREPGERGDGATDPARAAVIFEARVIFPQLARLEWLESQLLAADKREAGKK